MKITVEWLQERIQALEARYWEYRRWYHADFINDSDAQIYADMSEIVAEDIAMYKRKLERVRAREGGDIPLD